MTVAPPPLPQDIYAMRVMIVDDHEANLALLAELLHHWGFSDVVALTDSSQVVPRCLREPPDLLLLDLDMPAPSGLDIIRGLQAQTRGPVSLPVLVLTGSAEKGDKNLALQAGARDFLIKPFDLDEVRARVYNHLELRAFQLAQRRHEQELELRVAERTAELQAARLELVDRLARTGEFRHDETGAHTRRVGETSRLLALAAGGSPDWADNLRLAAPLHDIGKIAIPDAILFKDGPLTTEEFVVMRHHTVIGSDLLGGSASSLLEMAAIVALTHHEHWSGEGYPAGLVRESIPLAGRIVAIADVFDALTHERAYKHAWPLGEAVDEVIGQACRQFDPALVEAFGQLHHAELI